MNVTISVACDAPLSTLLNVSQESADASEQWIEAVLYDENDRKLRAQGGPPLADGTTFTLSFRGTGSLPETLSLYLYRMEEGERTPELSSMDCITLSQDK